jgi:hypothetical protein
MLAASPIALEPLQPAERRRRRRRRRLFLLLLLALSALPSVTTSIITVSLFRERAVLTTDAWAPLPIDVRAEPDMLMEVTGMLPGDQHGGQLTVSNVGADAIRYALVSSSTDPDGRGLRDVLRAWVRSEGQGCADFDGAVLYSGPLASAGFGDPRFGSQAGDRLLAPASSEVLCVRIVLPRGAGNAYQTSSTASTFTVEAELAEGAP